MKSRGMYETPGGTCKRKNRPRIWKLNAILTVMKALPLFEKDVYDVISLETCVNERKVFGVCQKKASKNKLRI